MRARDLGVGAILVAALACSASGPGSAPFCRIDGPSDLAPATIHELERGMRKDRVDAILGEPDYSPVEGQYYHATGGDCRTEAGLRGACGYVVDYRGPDFDAGGGLSGAEGLASCRWGGIAE